MLLCELLLSGPEGFVLLAAFIALRMRFGCVCVEAPARLNLPKLFLSWSSLLEDGQALMKRKGQEGILAGSSLQFQMCGGASHLEVPWHHDARQSKMAEEQLLFRVPYCCRSIEGLSTDS